MDAERVLVVMGSGAETAAETAAYLAAREGEKVGVLTVRLFRPFSVEHFVGALPQTYPASVCRYFLAVHRGASSCSGAATLENSSDAVALRLLAGACGGLLLAVAVATRRFLHADVSVRRMWNGASAAVATVTFLVAGAWLTATAADIAIQHGSGGVGWYVSGGIVSLIGAGAAGFITWRSVRALRPWAHVTLAQS